MKLPFNLLALNLYVAFLFIAVGATAQQMPEIKVTPGQNTSVTVSGTNSLGQSIVSYGETKRYDEMTYVKKDVKIDRYYTKEELNKIPKLELREIYKKRIAYIIEVLPFLSLHHQPGATLYDMGIPETESNIKHLEKETRNKQAFLNSLNQTLDDVIPYSDKTNIIWAILYFDEIIKKSALNTGVQATGTPTSPLTAKKVE